MPPFHSFPLDRQRAIAKEQQAERSSMYTGRWDPEVFKWLKFVEATKDGRFIWELNVTKLMVNGMDGLHGGCLSTIVDVATSVAKGLTDTGEGRTVILGPSVDLSTSFVSAAKLGETIFVEVALPAIRKTMMFARIEIYQKNADGTRGGLVSQTIHTVALPTVPRPNL
ncbi:hypothetical protein DFJ73DRAFT_861701 [Zopfochytrium polystomum]|nr:hypothetical protein DFJ73DRAFT_861701 [Zopfochytrium polystomum]